jgi:hypothetical protein
MQHTFYCQHCGKRFTVDESLIGRRGRCKQCHNEIVIPALPVEARPESPKDRPMAAQGLSSAVPEAMPLKDAHPLAIQIDEPVSLRPGKPARTAAGPVVPRRNPAEFAWLGVVTKWSFVLGTCVWLIGVGLAVARLTASFWILLSVAALGMGMIALGNIASIILPFFESITQGLLGFVPIYPLYYLITRWQPMKRPFFLQMSGLSLLMAALLATAFNPARPQFLAQLQPGPVGLESSTNDLPGMDLPRSDAGATPGAAIGPDESSRPTVPDKPQDRRPAQTSAENSDEPPLVPGKVASPGTRESRAPEAVALDAFEALKRGRLEEFTALMHPEALKRYRSLMMTVADLAEKDGKAGEVLALFQGVRSVAELKKLDDAPFYTALQAGMLGITPDAKRLLATTEFQIIAHVGNDSLMNVIYISRITDDGADLSRTKVISLRKLGANWRLLPGEELEGMIPLLKQKITGQLIMPDLAAAEVKVLGSHRIGNKINYVVYRLTTPLGDSKVSKIDVVSLTPDDAIWARIQKWNGEPLDALIRQKLGLPGGEPPPPSSERPQSVSRPAPSTRRPTQGARSNTPPRPGLAKNAPTPTPPGRSRSARNPDGILDPDFSFRGQPGYFEDRAPKGAILVGLKITYHQAYGRTLVQSVRPIFQQGDSQTEGNWHGPGEGTSETIVARPGYAVGALTVRTGLVLNGIQVTFMRVDGEGKRLSEADRYDTDWYGASGGAGRTYTSSGNGKSIVGIQGRLQDVMHSLAVVPGP